MWSTVIFSLLMALEPLLMCVGYLTNNTSFPQPLNKEEEEKYLILYECGNEDAKNILIEKNLRLVAHVVKKYHNTGKDLDDLISIGTIGLIKAITTYDRKKGTRLATYAARCIDNTMFFIILYIFIYKIVSKRFPYHSTLGIYIINT
ncbi:sigma factor [Clostridiisalibacter paucivorans]|uniref:sigma factor n=1 Tax=Clostridiisalibacter paucivorans TaxID=408753 RepID=UPI0004799389|nr:sigma factor [Clostridiisalibacter paucivorans]